MLRAKESPHSWRRRSLEKRRARTRTRKPLRGNDISGLRSFSGKRWETGDSERRGARGAAVGVENSPSLVASPAHTDPRLPAVVTAAQRSDEKCKVI